MLFLIKKLILLLYLFLQTVVVYFTSKSELNNKLKFKKINFLNEKLQFPAWC